MAVGYKDLERGIVCRRIDAKRFLLIFHVVSTCHGGVKDYRGLVPYEALCFRMTITQALVICDEAVPFVSGNDAVEVTRL